MPKRVTRWPLLVLATLLGCGPPREASEPTPTASATPTSEAAAGPTTIADKDPDNVGVTVPGLDVCATNEDGSLKYPIPEGTYQGILRTAKCNQQKFLIMARVASALGVECNYCHVPDPNDPKKEIYAEWTDRKRTANWMHDTFIRGLSPTDGNQIACKSCHAGSDGKGLAKILKDPRDRGYAQEWMHEVMTTKFVEVEGKRLKCKTCHVGAAPDLPGWLESVVRKVRYDPATGIGRDSTGAMD
jgi:hypothetical protein